MSSYALNAVLEARGIPDDMFRLLVWLAEHDCDGIVHVDMTDLGSRIDRTCDEASEMVSGMIEHIPAFREVRIFRQFGGGLTPHHYVAGVVNWEALS